MSSLSPSLRSALSGAKVTKTVVVESNGLAHLGQIFAGHFHGKHALVVADLNTYAAAGKRAMEELQAAGVAAENPYIFETSAKLKADAKHSRHLADTLREDDHIIVAVGSGVLNDLGKHASSLLNRPYVCVPTAASMDGYSASGASLLDNGFKRTLPCPPPEVIIADIDIIRKAPPAMAGWGFGDLAGKLVAALDWHIADVLGEDPIDPVPFAMVQDNLVQWLSNPGGIAAGEEGAITDLISGLLISGFAIQAHGDSRPASGSEHQFSHLWEMEGLEVDGNPASHGACVGLASVAMLALYDRLLDEDVAAAALAARTVAQPGEAELRARLESQYSIPAVLEAVWGEAKAKLIAPERLDARREKIAAVWPDLLPVLRKKFMTPGKMAAILHTSGTPTHPVQMNMSLAGLQRDFYRAQFVRRRYTVLDLLRDADLHDRLVAATFGPDGYWAQASS